MRILIDTHILIWCLENNPTLPQKTREIIIDPDNIVFVSVASAWEILIKKAKGQLNAPDDLKQKLDANQFIPLPITLQHVLTIESLPKIHHDPFDRIMIAQAKTDNLLFITRDPWLKKYGINILVS